MTGTIGDAEYMEKAHEAEVFQLKTQIHMLRAERSKMVSLLREWDFHWRNTVGGAVSFRTREFLENLEPLP